MEAMGRSKIPPDRANIADGQGAGVVTTAPFRLFSWNLLHRRGARCADVVDLLSRWEVDLAVFQEASEELDGLPVLLGGSYRRLTMRGRQHGPAAWSPHAMEGLHGVDLPAAGNWDMPSPVFKKPVRRVALVAQVLGITVATVHLDHGQVANRAQIRHLVQARPSVSVVAGDFNAIGPLLAPGFLDVGPRAITHMAKGILPLRLDRCLVRGMSAISSVALDRGRSDHRPILIELV